MKVRIKKTGEIKTVVDYARIEVEDCDSYGKPLEFKLDEVELINDDKEVNFPMTDWNQVRIQAAIVAMQGLLAGNEHWYSDHPHDLAKTSVMIADELVEELEE